MIGMLWYDNSTEELCKKLAKAATYYVHKYGKEPNLCFVHPQMVAHKKMAMESGIEIRTSRQILPNHLWIGCDGQEGQR